MSLSPGENFVKLIKSSRPGDGLPEFVVACPGVLTLLEKARDIPAGPKAYHSGSVLIHLARCMNETAGDHMAVWMALCHDSGKLTTPASMLPHHYNH
ncbi:MAG: tRNA nucleotidyltransferase, partial [Desulfovibrio sp.]|nr:tRNA nucleotidyltransferase [Desulfovibrio sp.]